jgi:hypothetical protein
MPSGEILHYALDEVSDVGLMEARNALDEFLAALAVPGNMRPGYDPGTFGAHEGRMTFYELLAFFSDSHLMIAHRSYLANNVTGPLARIRLRPEEMSGL